MPTCVRALKLLPPSHSQLEPDAPRSEVVQRPKAAGRARSLHRYSEREGGLHIPGTPDTEISEDRRRDLGGRDRPRHAVRGLGRAGLVNEAHPLWDMIGIGPGRILQREVDEP
jgi:hypothetical protein